MVANILLEIYFYQEIIVVQDEIMIFSNDKKMCTWEKSGEPAEIHFRRNRYNFYKLAVYAIIDTLGNFFYMLTSANFNQHTFLYFM